MKVPFDWDGNMMRAAPNWDHYLKYFNDGSVDYREINEFSATMHFVRFVFTGHSAYAIWKNFFTGRNFPMSLEFLAEVMERGIGKNGVVSAQWIFAKQGNAYSIRLKDHNE